jgi:hypothetical protein
MEWTKKHLNSKRHQPQGDLSERFGWWLLVASDWWLLVASDWWLLVASDWWLVAGLMHCGHGLGIAGIAGLRRNRWDCLADGGAAANQATLVRETQHWKPARDLLVMGVLAGDKAWRLFHF